MGNLSKVGERNRTVCVFTSDNGGPTHGFEGTESNNYPLKGGKKTLYEGGTRVVGLVSGHGIASGTNPAGRISYGMFHAADWLPTLVGLAMSPDHGGVDAWRRLVPSTEPMFLPDLGDGIDNWAMLSGSSAVSRRTELLHECHADRRGLGDALTVGDWKILRQNVKPLIFSNEEGWFPPPGQDPNTTTYALACGAEPPPIDGSHLCNETFCLFAMDTDPCEHHDVAFKNPGVVQRLVKRLKDYQATVDEQICGRGKDPEGKGKDECGCWPVMLDDGGSSYGNSSWAPCDLPLGLPSGRGKYDNDDGLRL